MHFWINKPAGRNYGARRYPCSSSAPKTRSDTGHAGQGCRRGREIGPMVTPVHRFQNLYGSPRRRMWYTTETTPRTQSQRQQQQQHQHHHQQQQQQAPQNHQQHVAHWIPDTDEETRIPTINPLLPRSYQYEDVTRNIVTSNNVTNAAAAAAAAAGGGVNNDRQLITNETTNNVALNRAGFLDFSEISDTELAGYRLRCGVWITFVLATGFVSVAKFYFGNRDAGLDMLIFCGLLFTLLLSGCFYSTLFRRAHNNHRHQEHLEQEEQIATLAAALTIREDNNRGFQVIGQNSQPHGQHPLHLQLQLQQQQQHQQQQQQQQPPPPPPPPPPPYHIAILIPPPNSPEEAPPPSYDKAMNEDSANQTRVFIFAKDEDNN